MDIVYQAIMELNKAAFRFNSKAAGTDKSISLDINAKSIAVILWDDSCTPRIIESKVCGLGWGYTKAQSSKKIKELALFVRKQHNENFKEGDNHVRN